MPWSASTLAQVFVAIRCFLLPASTTSMPPFPCECPAKCPGCSPWHRNICGNNQTTKYWDFWDYPTPGHICFRRKFCKECAKHWKEMYRQKTGSDVPLDQLPDNPNGGSQAPSPAPSPSHSPSPSNTPPLQTQPVANTKDTKVLDMLKSTRDVLDAMRTSTREVLEAVETSNSEARSSKEAMEEGLCGVIQELKLITKEVKVVSGDMRSLNALVSAAIDMAEIIIGVGRLGHTLAS